MKIDELYPYVLAELPDCPDEMLRQSFAFTAMDLCRQTHIWNEIADAAILVDGIADYDIDYPSGTIAETVTSVWCGPREMRAKTMSAMNDVLPDWQTATSTHPIYYNSTADWGSISVYPTPRGLAQLGIKPSITLRGVFIPKATATDLPNFLTDRYLECLCAGVKGRLMLQPNQKWSNPQIGAFYKGEYERMRGDVRVFVLAERVPGVTRVRPIRFGG